MTREDAERAAGLIETINNLDNFLNNAKPECLGDLIIIKIVKMLDNRYSYSPVWDAVSFYKKSLEKELEEL